MKTRYILRNMMFRITEVGSTLNVDDYEKHKEDVRLGTYEKRNHDF